MACIISYLFVKIIYLNKLKHGSCWQNSYHHENDISVSVKIMDSTLPQKERTVIQISYAVRQILKSQLLYATNP